MSNMNPFGALEKRGVKTDAVSMSIPDDLSFDEAEKIGKGLSAITEFSALKIPWYIGDWIVFCSSKFPDTYHQAVDFTGLSVGTLYNYAYVCRNVPRHVRRETLGLAVHQEVAKIKDEEKQGEWLTKADLNGWTKMELRRAIQGLEPIKPIKVDDIVVKVSFDDWYAENEEKLAQMPDEYESFKYAYNQGVVKGIV